MKKAIKICMVVILLAVGIGYLLNELAQSRTFQFFGGLVSQVDTNEKVVALTFDDGPGANTKEILTILEEVQVKGTFYLIGSDIENNMEEAKSIVDAGHEIGNHTYSHQRMIFKSPSFIEDEIEKTDELIREIGFKGEITFRPPYGKRLVMLPHYLSKHERKTIFMNIEPDSHPEISSNASKMVHHVEEHIQPGSIILLHVMYESRKESLQSVEGIIKALRGQGYTFVTVSELIEYENQE